MATMIPEYNWTDWLKVQKLGRLAELKSGEVMFNGEYYFTFVNGNNEKSGYQRVQAEYNAVDSNSVGGIDIKDILEVAVESVPV